MHTETIISQKTRREVARKIAKIRRMLNNIDTRQQVLHEIYIKWLK